MGTITLNFKHYTDDSNVEHLDIENYITGGIPGTQEERSFDGVERKHSDMHFGPQLFYAKRRAPEDNEGLSEFLTKGWTQDTLSNGLIETQVKADTPEGAPQWRELHVGALAPHHLRLEIMY